MATVMERTNFCMKSKANVDDILTILLWVKTISEIEGKSFKYQNLQDQAETYKYTNTPLDTRIHPIDELMIDAFRVYDKLKKTKEKFNGVLEKIDFTSFQNKFLIERLNGNKDVFNNEISKYEKSFEELMENFRYEYPEIRGIQKGVLTEKMNEYVASEDYEHAAIVRDIIKEC